MDIRDLESIKGKPRFRNSLKLLIPYLLREWKLFSLGLLAMLLVSAARLIDPLILAHVVDFSVPRGDTADMLHYAGLFVIVVLLSGFLTWGQIVILSRLGLRIITELKGKVFQHLMKVPLSFFDQRPVGDLIARVENDSERIRVLFSDLSVRLLGNVLFFVGIVIVLSIRSPFMAWGFVLPVTVLSIGFGLFYQVIVRFYRRVREKYSEVTSNLTEYIQGMPVVQVFDQQNRIIEHIDTASGEKQRLETRVGFLEYGIQGFFIFVVNTALLGVVILVLAPKIIEGTYTIGSLIIFTQYIMRITWPLIQLLENYMQMQRSFVSMARIQELLNLEIEEHHNRENQPAVFENSIEFRDVWFAYEAEKWVLRNVSFKMQKGEQLAFVGPSGSGKTTIISLLCGFYQVQKGEILIDGVNINLLDNKAWRRKIGLILQEIYLFPGNVLENVRIYNDEIDVEEVKAALKAVEAHKFTQEEYLFRELAERGKNISQGERQLLSFARALVYNPDLVIMDEATSSIDTVTEAKIQHSMETLLTGKTALIIAHRLSSVLKADCIHYMENGEILASGKHGELMQKSPAYLHLVQLQFPEVSNE